MDQQERIMSAKSARRLPALDLLRWTDQVSREREYRVTLRRGSFDNKAAAFFSRGTSGQWRDLLDDGDLVRYAARVRALASDDLVGWLHREPID